ncbi:hypothetical protein O3P69_008662 [Scylla paramamosain]|uniref:Uncharacterized protein n=1 Tax=Scylla paramamosain TaxID=85552 RepID=A0AAW0SLQ6_SCYPA
MEVEEEKEEEGEEENSDSGIRSPLLFYRLVMKDSGIRSPLLFYRLVMKVRHAHSLLDTLTTTTTTTTPTASQPAPSRSGRPTHCLLGATSRECQQSVRRGRKY